MIEMPSTVEHCRRVLLSRLTEAAPGHIQLLTGPRQVGKTTLLLEIAEKFGPQAVYAAGDEPGAALPGFWERCWHAAEERAQSGKAVLLLDEVHHLPDWAARLKGYWDRARRRHAGIHVIATGSSALRVAMGSRESLAGRFERLTLNHWPAVSLASAFHLPPHEAAASLVRFGSYPGAVQFAADPLRWRAYVLDAIIEPAIGRDVLAMAAVRRPALLRQIFALAIGMPAQIVSLQKLQGQLLDKGALETIAHYLALLQDAYLIAPLERYSAGVHRRRAAPPKLIALNNALISATHPGGAPEAQQEPERFGRWVENACLATAINQGQHVGYWREEPFEIDGVLEGSWGHWALEIKTGKFAASELQGLLEFTRRHSKFKPLVITAPGDEARARSLRIPGMNWQEFLLSGPSVKV